MFANGFGFSLEMNRTQTHANCGNLQLRFTLIILSFSIN